MARDYQTRLADMRAYAKTPADKAAKKRSQAKWSAKRKACTAPAVIKSDAKPLLNALANWR